jgi:serine-type D-Ala-D-Ala endopeptidase (penicillin-binding protein 7)
MRPALRRNLSVAALIAALVGAGVLGTLTYDAYQRREAMQQSQVARAPAPEPSAEAEAVPAAPPGTEVVPPEEAETDRGPSSASPSGPTLSFGRAAGLHLTPDPLKLNSSAAVVVDQDSGEVLVQKNAQFVLPIASLTKLLTSLVVLEANQPMDEVLTITEEDVDNERHSRSRLRVGTTLTRQEALRLALMSSENRAAHALGRSYPGGLERMVAAMNAKARQLGMVNSSFVDPTGLSNANKSTARDVAILVKAAARNPLIAEFSTTPQHLANLGGRNMQYLNSNRLVRKKDSGWNIALQKTGYIVEAGRCLTMVSEVAGRHLVMVLLDAESNGARTGDAEKLRRWAVAQWGGPEAVAALDAEKKPIRQVAAVKKARSEIRTTASDKKAGKKTTVRRKDAPRKTATASKKPAAKQDVAAADKKKPAARQVATAKPAKKEAAKKEGRVRQSFAAGKDPDKS